MNEQEEAKLNSKRDINSVLSEQTLAEASRQLEAYSCQRFESHLDETAIEVSGEVVTPKDL